MGIGRFHSNLSPAEGKGQPWRGVRRPGKIALMPDRFLFRRLLSIWTLCVLGAASFPAAPGEIGVLEEGGRLPSRLSLIGYLEEAAFAAAGLPTQLRDWRLVDEARWDRNPGDLRILPGGATSLAARITTWNGSLSNPGAQDLHTRLSALPPLRPRPPPALSAIS